MSRLLVDAIGPSSSVQDTGRSGAQRYGLTSSGAMDRMSLAEANVLVGRKIGEACLELGPLPATLRAEHGAIRLACTGALREMAISGRKVEMNRSVLLQEGEALVLGAARPGVFSYLAFEGGIAGKPSFGSLSVTARAGIGSPYPRPLRAGDTLEVGDAVPDAGEVRLDRRIPGAAPIRVVLGPQEDYFTREQIDVFFAAEWSIALASDRMGYRLEGPAIAHARGSDIISDGIVNGHIQIPGNGQPLVLLADRGTTGGYPKIGAVITADLGRFAQTEVAGKLRFACVTIEEAQVEAIRFHEAIAALSAAMKPIAPAFGIESLLAANLTGAVVQANDSLSWGGFLSAETGFEP